MRPTATELFNLYQEYPVTHTWREYQLLRNAVHFLEAAHVVELGTESGVSTQILADAAAGYDGVVMTVDINDCRAAVDPISNVVCIHLPSEQACLHHNSGIDLLYIDSDHTHEQILKELKGWSKFMNPGGLILCHDIYSFPGVKTGITEWLEGVKGWKYDEYPPPHNGMGLLWAPGER